MDPKKDGLGQSKELDEKLYKVMSRPEHLDSNLTEQGKREARETRETVASMSKSVELVVCSSMARALETANGSGLLKRDSSIFSNLLLSRLPQWL